MICLVSLAGKCSHFRPEYSLEIRLNTIGLNFGVIFWVFLFSCEDGIVKKNKNKMIKKNSRVRKLFHLILINSGSSPK